MKELTCSTIAVDTIDRRLNASANITFSRLGENADQDDWAENEAVKVTLAGTPAFLGTARRRGYDLDSDAITYDAVDGVSFSVRQGMPQVPGGA